MKKLFIILLAFLLVAGFTACDGQSAPTKEVDENKQVEQPKVDDTQEKETESEQIKEPEAADEPQEQEEPAKKDWLIVVIAFEGYNEPEYEGVVKAFEDSNINLITVSTMTGEASSTDGGVIAIEQTIAETDDPGLGIVVIGGGGCMMLWDDDDLINIIRQTNDKGDLIAAICAAPGVLANADIIDGKNACWSNFQELDDMMAEAGCTDTGQSVTIDGNLITGNGPPAADEFGAAVFDYVSSM